VVNVGAQPRRRPAELRDATLLLASGPDADQDVLPAATAAWYRTPR
jgi:hypothetical protein